MPPAPTSNLFQLPNPPPVVEVFTALVETPHLRIERIVSTGQTTPPANGTTKAKPSG